MKKQRLVILQNEKADDHHLWEAACRERAEQVEWDVVDLTRADWLERIRAKNPDGLLARPPAYTMAFKTLFDERVAILNTICGIPVYPSLEEISIYENKKYFSYWLKARGIPHPETRVFYRESEALDFAGTAALPLVGKTNIGASGRGGNILKTRPEALDYIRSALSGGGAAKSVGPNWKKKGFAGRVVKKLLRPGDFKAKLKHYQSLRSDVQTDFVILQEFVPHSFEWRTVKIGDSFFAHKKIVQGEKASGTLLKGYENPPLSLLDFVRELTDGLGFLSQAIDIFETDGGRYLVNEMQCVFGQSDPYQMLVDGQPGRYRHLDGQWVFEAGDFNRLQSFALRLEHFLGILGQKQLNAVE